jgi:hypothetical protein
MGLKDDLATRCAPILQDAKKLDKTWSSVSQEDINAVLGDWFGVAYRAIGALIDSVMDLAGEIDGIKHETS